MTRASQACTGWIAPKRDRTRACQVERQLRFLLPAFTPRTVFMEIGSPDAELGLRAAAYVERVWCIDGAGRPERAPCNLRTGCLGGVPAASVDIAFSERLFPAAQMRRLLAPGGVWFVYGAVLAARSLRAAGFARVQYFAGALRVPGALARLARPAISAAYA